MVWDTRAAGKPVAILGVAAGDTRTTHAGGLLRIVQGFDPTSLKAG